MQMYDLMLVVSVVVLAAVIVAFARHRAFGLYHPLSFYLMFHTLVFVIRPIFARVYDFHTMYDAIGFSPSEWERSQVLICTNLALVTFAVFSLSIGHSSVHFSKPDNREVRSKLLSWYWLPAIPIAALGLWSVIYGWTLADSMDQIVVRDAKTGGDGLKGVSGYFLSMGTMLSILGAIIAWLGRFRLWSLLPLGLFSLLQLGGGGRGQVVSGVTAVALLYLFDKHRKWPSFIVVIAFVVSAMAFNAIQTDRGAGIRGLFGLETEKSFVNARINEKPLETMDLANMEFFEYLVWAIPKRTGSYDYFLNNLQLLTEPVPRSLWADKPYGAPIKMFELYRYAQPLGATASMAGAGWMQWGYPGVLIWSALFGALYGWVYQLFTRRQNGTIVVVAYMIFLSAAPTAFRDGGLMTIAKQMLFYLVPVFALWVCSRLIATKRPMNGPGNAQGSNVSPAERRRRAVVGQGELDTTEPTIVDLAADPVAHKWLTPRDRRAERATRRISPDGYVSRDALVPEPGAQPGIDARQRRLNRMQGTA